jgi:hypothetical protein
MKKMKKRIYLLIILLFFAGFAQAQTTKTVGGAGADYSTLKLAFDAIYAGTIQGQIILQITGNTTETASAVLNASGTGSANYTSVLIYPTVTGKTIGGNLAAPLIDLNGADNVTFDGRLNQSGAADLIITNTSVSSTAGTSTIRFINSAENNIVKYCTLKGSATTTSITGGVIFFSTANAGNGNDGNSVEYNEITCNSTARPVNGIFSLGSTGFENSGNNISYNNFNNLFNPAIASSGIYLNSFNTSWGITGNSFYETTSLDPTSSVSYNAIQIAASTGSGFTISGNYIGGSTSFCGGTAMTKTASNDNVFYAINISVGTTTASSVQNNTIKNINWSNSGAAAWYGINILAGAVNIGTSTGNTLGEAGSTGSLTITGGATGTNVYGIDIAGNGTVDCQKNTLG